MINPSKLEFWLKQEWNVLFEGPHGIGKTHIILEAFRKAGLRFAYFSGSTMDPFVDFVGIPMKVEGPNGPSIQLMRPKVFSDLDIQAIFIDEYNRTHPKIRNATMELIQFKTINGQKISKDLKVVWAAINPDSGDDSTYDTDRLDPAQRDRFHIHVTLPNAPHLPYFVQRYGEDLAKKAVDFYNGLTPELKSSISPRRLDYALEVHQAGGDVRDVLAKELNPTRFAQMLRSESLDSQLKKAIQEVNEGRVVAFGNPQFARDVLPLLKKGYIEPVITSCLAAMTQELQSEFISTDSDIQKLVRNNLRNHKKESPFAGVAEQIIASNPKSTLAGVLKQDLHVEKWLPTRITGITSSAENQLRDLMQKDWNQEKVYAVLKQCIPSNIALDTEFNLLVRALGFCCRARLSTIVQKMPMIPEMVRHVSVQARDQGALHNIDIIPMRQIQQRYSWAFNAKIN